MIRCPFNLLTGLNCPFCGTQRMMLALLHGNLSEAFQYHPLLFLLLPFILTWGGLYVFCPSLRCKMKFLYSGKAILCYIVIAFLWGIIRNFYGI